MTPKPTRRSWPAAGAHLRLATGRRLTPRCRHPPVPHCATRPASRAPTPQLMVQADQGATLPPFPLFLSRFCRQASLTCRFASKAMQAPHASWLHITIPGVRVTATSVDLGEGFGSGQSSAKFVRTFHRGPGARRGVPRPPPRPPTRRRGGGGARGPGAAPAVGPASTGAAGGRRGGARGPGPGHPGSPSGPPTPTTRSGHRTHTWTRESHFLLTRRDYSQGLAIYYFPSIATYFPFSSAFIS